MLNAYIYDGVRTPIGRFGGALAQVRPDDLLAEAIKSLAARNPAALPLIEDVVAGCAGQAGEDTRNVARNALLLAGLSPSVGGETVNRLCGSGLCAVIGAARAISVDEARFAIGCGVESMTRAPLVMAKADKPWSRNVRIYDSTIGSRFPNPRAVAVYGDDPMPETAENIAADLGIGRVASDAFAARSQRLYAQALASGFIEGELIPVEVTAGRTVNLVTADEHPRPQSDETSLAALRPLREGGVVTAGNASGINDGAAAILLGSREAGADLGMRPIARIISSAVAGIEPRVMGLGPVTAINKALQRARITLDQCDVIEINEAFAVQVLGCLKQLGIAFDDSRVNPNGGAIAIGHPLGASGVRIALSAARQLVACGGRYAIVSLCIGVGQGVAIVIEREDG
ncbi:MAG: acetyl-CoA C-acyltransferase [Pontixanthobacter sp.]|nr:acetyl-CoA C-acyltransferase [Sphingorhabdus sp.]